MSRVFFYKMMVDNGGAPCVEDDLWSLAICKPGIRKSAKEGDLVLGFAAKSMADEAVGGRASGSCALIHAARVTCRMDGM